MTQVESLINGSSTLLLRLSERSRRAIDSWQAVKKNLAEQGDSLGIPIYIEELTKRDKRFHQYKTVTAMSDWQKENITCSPVLIEIGAEPAYDPLLAKVHHTPPTTHYHPPSPHHHRVFACLWGTRTALGLGLRLRLGLRLGSGLG